MTIPLTEKQNEIYHYLLSTQRAGRPAPSIDELSRHFGFRSSRSIRDHLKALERKGYIQKNPNKARSIRVLDSADAEMQSIRIPLVGSIPAGHPEETLQDTERHIHIDGQSIGFSPTVKCYALCVSGDSMIGRGIYEGDIAIVDRAREPRDGDVVVALIDNESTLKTLTQRNGKKFLRPENEAYPDMIPVNELIIQGVVRTIIRHIC